MLYRFINFDLASSNCPSVGCNNLKFNLTALCNLCCLSIRSANNRGITGMFDRLKSALRIDDNRAADDTTDDSKSDL